MGRSLRIRKVENAATHAKGAALPWWDEISANARAHGARPYIVEGFSEITDAVRRGHAVLVRREQVEVADGQTVFSDGATPVTGSFAKLRATERPSVVAILRFDVSTARFVLQDAGTAAGAVQLTPRRLARYLDDPARSTGVALGA